MVTEVGGWNPQPRAPADSLAGYVLYHARPAEGQVHNPHSKLKTHKNTTLQEVNSPIADASGSRTNRTSTEFRINAMVQVLTDKYTLTMVCVDLMWSVLRNLPPNDRLLVGSQELSTQRSPTGRFSGAFHPTIAYWSVLRSLPTESTFQPSNRSCSRMPILRAGMRGA